MARITQPRERLADERVKQMYSRMLSTWAADMLTTGAKVTWPVNDPLADHNDRDWRKLYTGSILDD